MWACGNNENAEVSESLCTIPDIASTSYFEQIIWFTVDYVIIVRPLSNLFI